MTDTNRPIATATVIDADIRDTATATRGADAATATDVMVTAEEAADMAGVSVRTIRRWMQQGHLPHGESERGKLVSPADIPAAKQCAARGRDIRRRPPVDSRGRGHDHGHDNADTDAATDTAMLSYAATAQMEAIRDQWLRPLVDRIEDLSRENGRLEQERDQLLQRVASLELLTFTQPEAPRDRPAAEPIEPPAPVAPRPWWKRLLGIT